MICDRFINSTRVYQGALGKVDQRLIRSLERVTVGSAFPELTFILDVPAQIGLARAKSRRGQDVADRFEAESLEFHEKLRQAYRALAAEEPKRCIVIDGRAPRDVVADRIWSIVQERLPSERHGVRGDRNAVTNDDIDDRDSKLPRETTELFGHAEAERALLDAYKSGRIAHAWLIGGPPGIGKATLAYRMARFVLAHPDPKAPEVQNATSLAVDPKPSGRTPYRRSSARRPAGA